MAESVQERFGSEQIETPDWYSQHHHKAGRGYRNVWSAQQRVSFLKTLGWVLRHNFPSGTEDPAPTRLLPPDRLAAAPRGMRVTWLGHATTYVQTPDLALLIDPMLGARASPFRHLGPKRVPPVPITIPDLPRVDVVLVSHDHYDHLDKSTVVDLVREFDPLFLVPLDVGAIVERWGATLVRELDWWQSVVVHGARFTCTPAQHFSGRRATNRDETLWCGWFVTPSGSDASLFYAGDTGYAPHFEEIRERLGAPDLALLPIGAFRPRWMMRVVHMDPEEALQAFSDLEANHFLPVHWGTFDMADDRFDEAPRRLESAASAKNIADRVHLLHIGGSLER